MAYNSKNSGLFTFQEFKNRGVIKQAPDVLVFLNGNMTEAVISSVSGKNQNMSFNDGITSVNVQNTIDNPGQGSASITITTPIYGEHSKYWISFYGIDGQTIRSPIFVPMMEVKIYFKGRFLVDGSPKYYPSFWGFIVQVEENFSGGVYTISLQCSDMLHWWAYSQINIHPVPASGIAAGGGQIMTAYSTIFTDANPYTILYRMTQSMGMHEFVTPTWLAQKTPLSQLYPPQAFKSVVKGIMQYWEKRFSALGSVLKMYGVMGQPLKPVEPGKVRKWETFDIPGAGTSSTSEIKNTTEDTNITGKPLQGFKSNKDFIDNAYLNGFTVFFQFDKMGTFNDAEYMSKLDIAIEIKNRCEFEFFQDVNGQWIFKPPFYNLNTKYVPPYRIDPADVINQSFQTNAEEITTILEVQTPFHPKLRGLDLPSGRGFHIDIDLAKRYGVKFKRVTLEYIRSTVAANMMAMGHMAFLNAKAFTGSITIVGRPELRLGFPIYLGYRDSFHYVKSINHSFDYGSAFTTTLALEAERTRMYKLEGDQFVLERDKIYLYRGAGAVTKEDKDVKAGRTDKESTGTPAKTQLDAEAKKELEKQISESYSSPWELSDNAEKARQLLASTGRIVGVEQGRYDIVPREGQEAKDKGIKDPSIARAVTQRSIPFTDEEGYRHIGAFRYGRGISVTGGTGIDEDSWKLPATNMQAEDSITKMTVGSVAESENMKDYAATIREGREGLIPAYLEGFNIRTNMPDVSDITPDANQVDAALSALSGKTLSNAKVKKPKKVTKPPAPPAPIPPEGEIEYQIN